MKLKKMVVLIASVVYLLLNCSVIYNLKVQVDNLTEECQSAKEKIDSLNSDLENNTETINKLNKLVEDVKNWKSQTISLGVCKKNSTTKSFMDYKMITDKNSQQHHLIKDVLSIRNDGLLTDKDGYVAVALSSLYGNIGDRFIVELSSGKNVNVIKADEKADKDVINKCYHPDGSMVELIIDINVATEKYREAILMGDFNYSDFFNGEITNIKKVLN